MSNYFKKSISTSGVVISTAFLVIALVLLLFFASTQGQGAGLYFYLPYFGCCLVAGYISEIKAKNDSMATSITVGAIATVLLGFVVFSTSSASSQSSISLKILGGFACIALVTSMIGGALAGRFIKR